MSIKTFEGRSALDPIGGARIVDPNKGLPVVIAPKKLLANIAQEWLDLFLKTIGNLEDAKMVGVIFVIAAAKFLGNTERELIDLIKKSWPDVTANSKSLGEVKTK